VTKPEITLEEFQQWKFEKDLLDAKLREVLNRAKALKADPKASDLSKRGARLAEIYVQQLGWYLPIGELDPVRAAFQALHVGVFADDSVGRSIMAGRLGEHRAQRKTAAPKGGKARAKRISADAAQHDAAIRKCVRDWNRSDELRDEHKYFTAYASKKTGLKAYTIRRRLEKLDLHPQQ